MATAKVGPLTLNVLHAPKEGNTENQYEDACAYAFSEADDRVTVAVADGASSAVFAREWANLLTGAFAGDKEGTAGEFDAFPEEDVAVARRLEELGKTWRSAVEGKSTSWYAQEKLPNGSSAALLVMQWDLAKNTWRAHSLGDVCVFVVRDNRLKYAFPITKSARFDDRPTLATTEASPTPPKVLRFGAACEPGDRFLLMTDAWAAYFLSEWEARRKPWNDLPPGDHQLPRWLKSRRDSGKLKNDDVTVVDLTVGKASPPQL